MAAHIPALVRLVEERAAAWRPDWPGWPRQSVLRPDSTVAVVGGGPAGVAAARTLLLGAARLDLPLQVVLLDRGGCQFCGALLTRRARLWLEEVLEMSVPPEVPQRPVRGVVYVNPAGAQAQPLPEGLAVTRSDRFGGTGLDRSLRQQITAGLPPDAAASFRLLRPARVTRVWRPGRGEPLLLEYRQGGGNSSLAADMLVLSCGLKERGGQPGGLAAALGYRPPALLAAGMWQVSLAGAEDRLGGRLALLDGMVPGATLAFIPQYGPWLTLASLGRHLPRTEVAALFARPEVQQLVRLNGISVSPACGGCTATIFQGAAPRVAGEGWLAAGDLAGYGRVFKDGYLAAFRSGALAARALLETGQKGGGSYQRELVKERQMNGLGVTLFMLNMRLAPRPWFARWMAGSLGENGYAGAAVRGLAGGETSYAWVALFFVLGLAGRLLRVVRLAAHRLASG